MQLLIGADPLSVAALLLGLSGGLSVLAKWFKSTYLNNAMVIEVKRSGVRIKLSNVSKISDKEAEQIIEAFGEDNGDSKGGKPNA